MKNKKFVIIAVVCVAIVLAVSPVIVKNVVKKDYAITKPIMIGIEDRDAMFESDFDKNYNVDIQFEVKTDGIEATNAVYYENIDLVSFGVFITKV